MYTLSAFNVPPVSAKISGRILVHYIKIHQLLVPVRRGPRSRNFKEFCKVSKIACRKGHKRGQQEPMVQSNLQKRTQNRTTRTTGTK
jgi:hypothetical protein